MKLRHSLVVPFVLLFSALVCAAPNSEMQEGANQLTSSIYTGPAMRTLRELSDGFGGRLTGSPAYNQAAEWAAAKFRSYGIQNVKLEPFAMDNGWVRGTAQRTVADADFTRAAPGVAGMVALHACGRREGRGADCR